MRWQQGRRSRNVEDRRGRRAPGGGTLLVVVVAVLLGADPRAVLRLVQTTAHPPAEQGPPPAPGDINQGDTFNATVL